MHVAVREFFLDLGHTNVINPGWARNGLEELQAPLYALVGS